MARSDEFREADAAAGCLIGLVFSLIAGLVSLLREGFVRLPKGIPIGYVTTRLGIRRSVGLLHQNVFKHTALYGATGSGKTTLLKRILADHIQAGFGIALIDPKGDLISEVLATLPPARAKDVVLVDLTDSQHPVALDLFEHHVDPDLIPLAASSLLAVFQKVLGSTWGHRMEHVLRCALLALIERGADANLLSMRRFLLDEQFRNSCLTDCTNPVVVSFWRDEFATYSEAQQRQMIAPILNRVGHFTTHPTVRNLLCQKRSTISIADIMNQQKILLVNLPATIGEDVAAFVGEIIVSKTSLATMQRAGLPQGQRRPFIVMVDEAQNFVSNNSFEKIITEARSMNVGFVLATQFAERLPTELRMTIEKNVATCLTCFLDNNRHQVLYQQNQDVGAPDFVLSSYPPLAATDTNLAQAIRWESRRKYSRSRATVEQEIRRQMVGEATTEPDLFIPEPWSVDAWQNISA